MEWSLVPEVGHFWRPGLNRNGPYCRASLSLVPCGTIAALSFLVTSVTDYPEGKGNTFWNEGVVHWDGSSVGTQVELLPTR